MSKWYGNILEDATIEMTFNTFDSNGASVTVTDLVAGDVQVYKDGVIQTTPGAGVTLSLNIGTNNGSHLISIDTSNATDAGFYAVGSNYEVRLNGITVDSQTINAFIGSFSIENRFMRGTDGANTTVPDAAGVVPTAIENRQEIDSNSTQLAAILADVTGIDGAAMRGTDSANTVVPMTAAVSQTEHDATQSLIAALKDFDPANDTVARVTLVDTATTNTDMRGTDNAALAAKLLALVQLILRSDAAITTDNATELTEINADGGSGAGDYAATTDSQEAIKDSISAGGGTSDLR